MRNIWIRLHPRREYNISDRLDEPSTIRHANNGRLCDALVTEKRIFHLDRRHPHSRHLHHVVASPAVMIVTVRVPKEFIAGRHPAIHCLHSRRILCLLPVFGERTLAAHEQIPDFASSARLAAVVRDSHLVIWNRRSARPSPRASRPIRNKNVQHLRGTNPIENLNAKSLAKLCEYLRRQRLARGNRQPHRRQIDSQPAIKFLQ